MTYEQNYRKKYKNLNNNEISFCNRLIEKVFKIFKRTVKI